MRAWIALSLGLWLVGWTTEPALAAGKHNPKLSLNDAAPAFAKLPSVDGKDYGFADFAKAKVLVIVFTCNSCPYAVDYEERLVAFHKQYCASGDVALVAINSNLIPEDSLDEMKKRAEKRGFLFPYLFDQSQQTAQNYGALRTPECFVLNQERKIVYMGALDDSAKVEEVKQKFWETAVQASLAGRTPETGETAPIGCLIRFKRTRN